MASRASEETVRAGLLQQKPHGTRAGRGQTRSATRPRAAPFHKPSCWSC